MHSARQRHSEVKCTVYTVHEEFQHLDRKCVQPLHDIADDSKFAANFNFLLIYLKEFGNK